MLPTISIFDKGQDIRIQICNSRMKVIGSVKEADSKSYDINTGKLNELSFTIPLYVDTLGLGRKKNKNANLLVNRCILKVQYGSLEEHFIIDNYDDSVDSEYRQIHAFSLGIQLNSKLILNYKSQRLVNGELMDAPIDIQTAMTDALKQNRGWRVGYVDPAFSGMYRSFEFDSQTGLEFIYQIGTAFNGIMVWDTKNKTVSAYHPDFYGTDKGFKITDEKYISNLVKKASDDEFCTRLYLYGKDGITINSVSPLGQSYIEDFSYFMNNGMMSQELIDSLTAYNEYVLSRQGEFPTLLEQLNGYQGELSTLNINMSTLKNTQRMVQDRLDTLNATNKRTNIKQIFDSATNSLTTTFTDVNKRIFFFTFTTDETPLIYHNGETISKSNNNRYVVKLDNTSSSALSLLNLTNPVEVNGYYIEVSDTDFVLTVDELEDKYGIEKTNSLVAAKQTEIDNKQSQINSVNADMLQLRSDLDIENHLSDEDLDELVDNFIISKEYSDENLIDPASLLEAGKVQLKERNTPQVLYDVSLINFLNCLEEKRNWDKISIFDIVRIQSKKLDVDIKARIVNIKVDKDNIQLTIANSKNVKDEPDKFIQLLYGSVSGTKALQRKEGTWDNASKVRTEFDDYLNSAIDATKQKIVAGVNETVQITERGIKISSPNDINTFLILNHGVVSFTKDGGSTWENCLTTDGLVAERLIGRVIIGSNLTMINDSGTFIVDGANVSIDGGSEKAKIIINPTDGIHIKTSPDDGQTWVDSFFVDTEGILHARGLVISDESGTSVMIDAKNKTMDLAKFDTILGKLKAENITVGSGTVFDEGYDPVSFVFGGRNYLLNSNFDRKLYFWVNSGGVTLDDSTGIGNCIKIDGSLATTKYITQSIISNNFKEIAKATKFSISALTKLSNYTAGTTNSFVGLRVAISYVGSSTITYIDMDIPASDWNRQTWQIVKPAEILNDILAIDFYVYGRDFTGQLYVDEIMFEVGSKPSSWKPAPEDATDQLYEQILTNYKTQLKTTKSEIDAKYAKIPQPTTSLKVATWNIHGGQDQNGTYLDLSKASRELLKGQALDLLGMQEVKVNYNASKSKYPMAALLTGVFYAARFFKSFNLSDQPSAEIGNGLLSKKFGLSNDKQFNLPNAGYENRILTQSEMLMNGNRVYVFVTHLTYQNDTVRANQMQYLKSKFDSLNGASFICFGDFNVRSTSEFDIFSPSYQCVNGLSGTFYDTYNLTDWSTRRIDNIICSKDFTVSSYGMTSTTLSDHSILWANLTIPNILQDKKNAFDTKYNDLISSIDNALADGKATEQEKLIVDIKIEAYKNAIAELGVVYDLKVQEIYTIDYQQNAGSVNEIIDTALRGDMRLDAPLPSFITMDDNGITATTSDPNKLARMDYRGFYVKQGAIAVERPDGYLIINDGLANFDFAVDSHEPPFMEGTVTQQGMWYRGNDVFPNYGTCNFFSFKHTARYLKMDLAVKGSGYRAHVRVWDGVNERWNGSTLNNTAFYGESMRVIVDLGTPTGADMNVYLQLATANSSSYSFVRVLRKWLEG